MLQFHGWLNVVGLALTTLAAFLMFFFPPDVPMFGGGGRVIHFVSNATEKDQREAAFRPQRCRRAAMWGEDARPTLWQN